MKKIVAILIVLALATVGFVACGPKPMDLTENVSYYQTHLYTGENPDFQVSVAIGKKEEIFIADGKAENVKDFAIINVIPLNLDLANKNFKFTLVAEGGDISGELKRDVISHAFTADIELGELADKIKSIKISYDDETVEIPLTNKISEVLNWDEILAIATKEFDEIIKENLDENNHLNREICIKFIRDKRNSNSPYYWYISFIGQDNSYWALLIDPKSGEIITKKC